MKLDPFIEAEKTAGHSVQKTCGLFEVSKSAYYERRNGVPSRREVSDAELLEKIKAIHTESKGTYGAPRIHKELLHRHIACGKRKVTRLMRQAGLEGRCKKRWRKTTVADPAAESTRDLIQRHFGPCAEMDRRYVGDITYISTWEGWAYLATVIDLASRQVVGWALADHMRTELVEDALNMAFANRHHEKASFSIRTGAVNIRAGLRRPGPRQRRRPLGRTQGRVLGQRGRRVRSSPPSSASSSTPAPGRHGTGLRRAVFEYIEGCTTPAACTRRSATSAPLNTKLSTTTPTLRRHNQHKQPVRRTGSLPRDPSHRGP